MKLSLALRSHLKRSPLHTLFRSCEILRDDLARVPGCRRLSSMLIRIIMRVHVYLDGSFDREYGVDTSGILKINNSGAFDRDYGVHTPGIPEISGAASKSVSSATYYCPIPRGIFRQIMGHLAIPFDQYEFIDFGSGKGRALIMASECGFKKVIGVEFLPEFHQIATRNVMLYEQRIQKKSRIETVCMDAVEYRIPAEPQVMLFFDPFRGEVLETVLRNIARSIENNPRNIIVLTYGMGDCMEPFKVTKLQCRELVLHDEWSEIHLWGCFLLQNAGGATPSVREHR